ncbi:class I SAM-dependent methyltransferase [Pelagibius sp. CAU 1746]|uniref:class I SAM-dependent methyltransferase n=1 Tax=Pelagibius sp. CAU 1746 TaxID=3140370 RepID=UPI00325A6850
MSAVGESRQSRCPVCGGEGNLQISGLFDDRYGYPNTYDLFECRACHHEFLPTAFSEGELTELYSDYYPRHKFDPEGYRPHEPLPRWQGWWRGAKCNAFRWVPEGVSVLDIGCGYGQAMGYHRNRGCRVVGVELDENARIIAERQGFDIRIGAFHAGMCEGETFDYVTLEQVIEHLQSPQELMRDVAKILKVGGRVIVTTPNASSLWRRLFGRKWIHWHTPYHVQFFNSRSMSLLAASAGLEIERHLKVTTPEWLHYQWIHLATCPDPGEPSVFWAMRPKPEAVGRKLHLLSRLHRSGFNHLATRLVDGIGLGDNQIFILKKIA